MYCLSVLQVLDPSCFFCEILKERNSEEYEQLFSELNFLYSTVYRDVEELKPVSLPFGTACVVFYEKMKSWCRATLESTTCSAQNELVDCFLLDFALYCPIKKTNIRFSVEECQKLPYRARKFKLHQIRPLSLCVNISEDKSEFRPTKTWDTAAINYFQQLLNESLKIEAQLCSVDNNCMGVYLYLTTKDSVICANDDLVAKKYASYENGNPEDQIENGKVISSCQTLQTGHPSTPLTGKSPQLLEMQEPEMMSILSQSCQKLISINQDTDFSEKTADDKRETVGQQIKERSAGSKNEKTLVSLNKEHRPFGSENEMVISPQPNESQSSKRPKLVTTPDAFLHPAWSSADPGKVSFAETAEKPAAKNGETAMEPSIDAMSLKSHEEKKTNFVSKEHQTSVFVDDGALSQPVQQHTIAEIGINSDENPNHTFQGKLKTSESNDKAEPDPAPFLWPAWCNRDQKRRLSTEITKKSYSQLSFVGENELVLTEEADKQSLARLLQFLSPSPKHLPEDESRKPSSLTKPDSVFVSNCLAPFSTLEETCLCTDIKKRLIMCGYEGPNPTEAYCWTPITEGYDTIVIAPDGFNPLYYIPPLLTYLSCASVAYKLLPAKHGPHAVIICPGRNKAHSVYNLLMEFSKYTRPLSPMLLLVGIKKEDIESITFRKQCEVIVTTPHSLLRCLEHHGFLLLRLCHLVFDEVDVLFSKAGSEMSEILQIYKKIVTVENREGTPQQIVAVGSKWIHGLRPLLQYTSTPRVVITRMEQAALFANVQQVIQLCLDCEKMSVLLPCLDFTPINTQKIIIFTKNDEEAELVHKVIQTASVYSLLLHKGLVHNFSHVLEQWKKVFSHRTLVVLVVTDDYAPLLEITDATCIIHYSFPEDVGVLSLRLYSLMDYIQCKINKISMEEDDYLRAKSVLLMTEKHASFAIDLLKILQGAEAKVPPELIALAQGLLQAWENQKQDQELCLYLKTFGSCNQDEYDCPYRHHINPSLDLHNGVAAIPQSAQYITVLPLCIVDAARFLGRVVSNNDPYSKLAAELNEYYQSPMNKVPARKVECKRLYAISDGSDYHRVQVLSSKTMDSVSCVHVQYVDDGKKDEIPVHMLFLLPPVFQSVPPQFREFIVCRIKPIDNEYKWDSKVIRIVSKSIKGKQHRAKVVLSLGKTYWLDPMVQVTTLSDLSSCVYDLNVRQEILSTGLGTDNPQHILHLKALLELSGSFIKCEEEENVVIPEKSTEDNNISTPSCPEKADPGDGNKVAKSNLLSHFDKEPEELKDVSAHVDSEPLKPLCLTSLFPEVKWFEMDKSVILTVKLRQVTDHKCTFYSDRLVFSCYAEGKLYAADMELYKEIEEDKSECTLRNGEAVITIQKRKAEKWNKLLKHKHPNVSFDFDHLEDSEDSVGFGSDINPTIKFYNVISEDLVSSDYSESESD
ncbi:putative ATP-dependent RNA helicase TDRD12 [Hyla sarda]|uniref:putative ATP-dependent RNA helicase TDRD12 n=1 Tax=Hyla sarda TaxID=327740 RepID=UPI0024C263EB|nr:putative ATP-dependent RNA helicase TDRD12 [Hyla sarda]XP_056381712.1 putative ATP-dependent RNA helicase TDRD12 [Hyla sarda]XP_056381713.1 putative ATP-dependent RNA helicase TDRD12 [Hyla sarda]XP_056381714.1 putative ATP-dependent RNA helicase TDRD12 [Hyla sarda]XP_056381716.1 putative ATP-dependent RNA helicase TDRD12 [Hyla sarda]XP_056381717.1 putative ATP-dependent RNA helicase TDRD12 [Hyla sarda]XP_056381718.1 putative ATP-dependent RNA helicase TDRD12 [Hyla sarda]XP_056381719.1 put